VPRVIITEGAAQGLERCRRFLAKKNPQAAKRAGQAIEIQFTLLETEPGGGRPFDDLPEFRELIIPFGDAGYVALYHHKVNAGSVYVLAFRHQKEAGY
jgi:plasmid stabilization system protein ParE